MVKRWYYTSRPCGLEEEYMEEENKELKNIKERIMHIALEEFGKNAYKVASTNVICKRAEVSKGTLYHYYKSKENIYLDVVIYVINKFKENIKLQNEDSNKKGIDYISEYFNSKFKFFGENPLYSNIIVNLVLDDIPESARQLANEFEEYNNGILYEIIKSIDFNPNFEREKAFELIAMIGSKLEEKHMKNLKYKDKDTVIEDFRQDHKMMIEMLFEGIDK